MNEWKELWFHNFRGGAGNVKNKWFSWLLEMFCDLILGAVILLLAVYLLTRIFPGYK